MGLDGRIGGKFLHAGAGFGGSCFPKDTRALLQIGAERGVHLSIVEAAVRANERQRALMAEKVFSVMGADLSGKTIAVLGLSFKPNTDDIREAPALDIIAALRTAGAAVRAYDPVAMENAKAVLPDVAYCEDAYSACGGADAVVIVTEWNQFRNLDLRRVKSALAAPVFFDFRNIYEPGKVRALGFTYCSIGRR